MQLLHKGSYYCKPHFGMESTYLITISAIHAGLHRFPLTLQPDRMWQSFSNMIALNGFNVFYM